MSRLYTRGQHRTYWADYVHPATGKRYQRSTRTRDKRVAAERLRQWELAAIGHDTIRISGYEPETYPPVARYGHNGSEQLEPLPCERL